MHMEMAENLLDEEKSTVAVSSVLLDNTLYWHLYLESISENYDYPAVVFGSYDAKLRDSLKVVSYFTPDDIDL